nr:hypothetical protein BgiMline_016829 [Biomphalaria glabrata]
MDVAEAGWIKTGNFGDFFVGQIHCGTRLSHGVWARFRRVFVGSVMMRLSVRSQLDVPTAARRCSIQLPPIISSTQCTPPKKRRLKGQ